MKNLLLIPVDDLFNYDRFRDRFGAAIETPNFDRLAAQGTFFEAAYASTPLCGPSRASILTGKSAFETGIFSNSGDFYDRLDHREVLPTAFHKAGYTTGLFGKIFHTHDLAREYARRMFDESSHPSGLLDEDFGYPYGGPAPAGTTDSDFADYRTIREAVDFIAAAGSSPFLTIAGLSRPHAPNVVPQTYFDLYPIGDIVAAGYPDTVVAALPDFAKQFLSGGGDPGSSAALAIQAYLASISFADAQLGRLLDALDAGGLWANTTVVMFSDHGYHAGDHDKWGKFTLWEEAANAPLIIADPDQAGAGGREATPVSLSQLFATIAELTGVAAPGSVSAPSFAGLIDPDLGPYVPGPVVTYAYGSISMRTANFRLIRYEDGATELYNLALDPEQLDNLALDPARADLMATMLDKLRLAGAAEGVVFDDALGILNGAAGDDVLIARNGVATAAGGSGDDVYFVTKATGVAENAHEGQDTVVLRSDGSDRKISYVLPDQVEDLVVGMGLKRVRVEGNRKDNDINAGKDGDPLHADGRGGDDRLYGGQGDDRFRGGRGDDRLFGDVGSDTLAGEAGNDFLDGGGRDDLIDPGAGTDLISTGTGADRIVLRPGEGDKLVALFSVIDRKKVLGSDFEPGRDVIELDGFRFASDRQALKAFRNGPEGAELDAEGVHLVLYGVRLHELGIDDIVLTDPRPGAPPAVAADHDAQAPFQVASDPGGVFN